jgi:SP family arabinose:H+ symporter-like MFS transporter
MKFFNRVNDMQKKTLFFGLIGFIAALGGFLFGFDTAVVSGTILKVLLLSALLFTLIALGCMISNTEQELINYRLVGGLGIGITSVVSPVYVSEISPAKIRGKMVSLYQMAITMGDF